MYGNMLRFVLLFMIPMAEGSMPGTFFWKPRLGIDLNIKATDHTFNLYLPTRQNIMDGFVVLIDGYNMGVTVIAFVAGLGSMYPFLYLNPLSAYYYTTAYRWGLRYLSLIPVWMTGNGGNYCKTHKTWLRRFYYMDQFVPRWLRHLFPYVKNSEWDKEEKEYRRFKKYSEAAFGRHYKYPAKKFNDFRSQFTRETMEGIDTSSMSTS